MEYINVDTICLHYSNNPEYLVKWGRPLNRDTSFSGEGEHVDPNHTLP